MGSVLNRLAVAAAVIAWALSTGAAAHGAPTVRLFAGPTPVSGTDGRTHLAYEFVVENGPRQRTRLESRVSGLAADPLAPARMPAALPAERTGQYPFTGDVVAFP